MLLLRRFGLRHLDGDPDGDLQLLLAAGTRLELRGDRLARRTGSGLRQDGLPAVWTPDDCLHSASYSTNLFLTAIATASVMVFAPSFFLILACRYVTARSVTHQFFATAVSVVPRARSWRTSTLFRCRGFFMNFFASLPYASIARCE